MKTPTHFARGIAVAATVLLLSAACSSKSSSTGSNAGAPAGSTSAAANASGATGGAATIQTANNALGTILTDASGRTLYAFEADTSNASTCYGQCAQFWPPVISTGMPAGGTGVDASKLATSPRKDGTTQVTYSGHPLYTFALDKAAGDAKGQGLNQQGGLWWVVGTDGNAIKGNAASSSSGSGFTY